MINARLVSGNPSPAQREGFTLVELSIVLVIIGLLIGGILVGQSLIDSAKINRTIQQFQQYNAAAMLFQDRYKCLPGDCAKPIGTKNKWVALTDQTDVLLGNGNGVLGDYESSGAQGIVGPETYNFWGALEQFSYIPPIIRSIYTSPSGSGAGIASPSPPIVNKLPGVGGGLGTPGGGWWIAGIDGDINSALPYTPLCRNAFTIFWGKFSGWPDTNITTIKTTAVAALDSKLDDGRPLSGKVTAIAQFLVVIPGGNYMFKLGGPDNPASANCLAGDLYNLEYTGDQNGCGILMCSDF